MRSFFGVATRRTGCAKHNGVKFILLRFVGLFEKKKKKKAAVTRATPGEMHFAKSTNFLRWFFHKFHFNGSV